MSFSTELAEIRFGCGLSPGVAGPASVRDMLGGLTGPDHSAAAHPIEDFSQFRQRLADVARVRAQYRKNKSMGSPQEKVQAINKAAQAERTGWFLQTVQRWVMTNQGFRERLVAFWGDHFTALGKVIVVNAGTSPYVEEAIRPNIAGRFGDLLIAAVTHPLMLHYLDQNRSAGPNSAIVAKRPKLSGLNENLAREILELHTLGVVGGYSQDDVRQLAELLTGLTYSPADGLKFRADFAEPGTETVLGKSYGGGKPRLADIHAALHDIALHPDTARHIAWKLAVHFVSDTPDPALVDALTRRYVETGGDLMQVYAALLDHPAAWDRPLRNVKPPFDFVASACRALAPPPDHLATLDPQHLNRHFLKPLALMGQVWQKPPGPDGWPEEDTTWITPQGLSARLRWAVNAPQALMPGLPDPRGFVLLAVGVDAPQSVHFAAAAAESVPDAIGLVLASPAFQRR